MKKEKKLKYIVYIIAILINVIVIVNSIIHDPIIGYDSDAHLDYITVVADHLPSESDSGEYFSPPLPYIIPGIAYKSCTNFSNAVLLMCKLFSGHVAQGLNAILAIGITLLVIKISELIRPNNKYFTISNLVMLGGLTVFYKTFSQVRGEPYVAFFTLLVVFIILKLYKNQELFNLKASGLIGLTLGLLALSRQWGVLIYPAVLFFLIKVMDSSTPFRKRMASVSFTFLIAALVGSWFYFHLYREYGKFTAFNVTEQKFSFSNQPFSFYRNTGIEHMLLFRSPTRKTFENQLIPLFYSEAWGDYWGYFTFIRDMPQLYQGFANQEQITPYLGRVNFVALIPTAIFVGGLLFGARNLAYLISIKEPDFNKMTITFFFSIVLFSSLGYFWFLIKYPTIPRGSTIKATYMIQVFMVLPFLAAEFLEFVRNKTSKAYFILVGLLVLSFLHNLPAMITRYWWWLR